jgi:hypothetical protein
MTRAEKILFGLDVDVVASARPLLVRRIEAAIQEAVQEAQADRERIYGIAMAWQARAEGAEADCVSLREALEEHRTRHLQEGGVHHCIDGLPFCETCPQARGRHCSCCRFLADTAALQSPHSGKAILEKEGKKQ